MGTGKSAFFPQRHRGPFVQHIARRQLVTAQRGIGKQGTGPAVDIDPAVGPCGTCVGRDGIQRFLVFHQILGQRLESLGAFLKVQRQQVSAALRTGKVQCTFKINGLGMGVGHGMAVDSAAQALCGLGAKPLTGDITLEGGGHGVPFNQERRAANQRSSKLRVTRAVVGRD